MAHYPLRPSTYNDLDLRPAIGRKGVKRFHLAGVPDSSIPDPLLALVPACGVDGDPRDFPIPKRHALRRGLTFCPNCKLLEEAELAAIPDLEEELAE